MGMTASGVDVDVRFHPEMPLVALLCPDHVHIAIAVRLLVDGDVAINVAVRERAISEQHTIVFEMRSRRCRSTRVI